MCGNMGVLKVLGTWNNFSVNIELFAFIVDRTEQLSKMLNIDGKRLKLIKEKRMSFFSSHA